MSTLPTPRVALGTSQDPLRLVGSGAITATGGSLSTSGASYSNPRARPTEILSSGSEPGRTLIDVDPATLGQLQFALAAADGAQATCNIWGAKRAGRQGRNQTPKYTFRPLLSLTLTAGSTEYGASDLLLEDASKPLFLVDTITVGTDWTRNDSAKVWAEMGNAWAVIDFDLGGSCLLMVEGLLGTATAMASFLAEC